MIVAAAAGRVALLVAEVVGQLRPLRDPKSKWIAANSQHRSQIQRKHYVGWKDDQDDESHLPSVGAASTASQKRGPGHRAASALRRYSMGNYDNFIKL